MSPQLWVFAGLFRQKQYSAGTDSGRGLRKMYSVDTKEYVSVIGTDARYGFCGDDSTWTGCHFRNASQWAAGTGANTPLTIEIDNANVNKNLDELDISCHCLRRAYTGNTKKSGQSWCINLWPWKSAFTSSLRKRSRGRLSSAILRQTRFRISLSWIAPELPITAMCLAGSPKLLWRILRMFSGYDVLYGKIKTLLRAMSCLTKLLT